MYLHHLYVSLVLVLFALPLYLIDRFLLRGKGGWISLDFRGALISTYGLILVVHLAISSLLLLALKDPNLLYVHLAAGVVSCLLVFGGYLLYDKRRRHGDLDRYVRQQAVRLKLMHVIELKRWWYIPDAVEADQIYIIVRVSESGRFSGNVQGRDASGAQLFTSTDTVQRKVDIGEEFTFVFSLKRFRHGKPEEVNIALYLFKDQTGSAAEDIAIIFTTHLEQDDDGHFFYAMLPEPD